MKRDSGKLRPAVEFLESRALLSAFSSGSHIGISHRVRVSQYRVEVVPLNGSGVQGRGRMVENFRLDGPAHVTMRLSLTGLTPGHAHAVSVTQPTALSLSPIPAPPPRGNSVYLARSGLVGPMADGNEPLLLCGMTVAGTYRPDVPVAVVRLHLTGASTTFAKGGP